MLTGDQLREKLRGPVVAMTTHFKDDYWLAGQDGAKNLEKVKMAANDENSEMKSAAFHEAGHAVMGSVYGYQQHGIFIEENGIGLTCQPHNIETPCLDNRFKAAWYRMALEDLDVKLAGRVAENMFAEGRPLADAKAAKTLLCVTYHVPYDRLRTDAPAGDETFVMWLIWELWKACNPRKAMFDVDQIWALPRDESSSVWFDSDWWDVEDEDFNWLAQLWVRRQTVVKRRLNRPERSRAVHELAASLLKHRRLSRQPVLEILGRNGVLRGIRSESAFS